MAAKFRYHLPTYLLNEIPYHIIYELELSKEPYHAILNTSTASKNNKNRHKIFHGNGFTKHC